MYHPPFVFTDEQFFSALQEGKTVYEMAAIFGVNRSSIYKRIRKYKIKVPFEKEKPLNEHVFDMIDTEEKAYWLGFLYADGCVTNKRKRHVVELSLKADDVAHLWKFNDFLEYDRALQKVKLADAKCGNVICRKCRLAASSVHLCNTLESLGCIPRKSLILKFPDMNIFVKKDLVYDFMRGYIDGDGCLQAVGKKRISLYISFLGTKEFVESAINALGCKPGTYRIVHKHVSNTYTVYLKTKESRRVADLMYKNATIYLDRKYEKYRFAVLNGNI